MVDKNTQVKKSEKYEAWKDDEISVQLMPLDKVPDVTPFTKINCEAKVLQVNDIVKTANGKKLQTATVADKTATARIVMWEDDVDKLSLLKCYRFEKLTVKEFRGEMQLSTSSSKIYEIDDIDAIDVKEENYTQQVNVIDEAKVIGVQLFEMYKACLKCRSKLPHGDEDEFDTCTRCGMLQCTKECNTEATAQMMIRSSSSTQNIILKAFGKCLHT